MYRRRNIISWPHATAVAAPMALGVALSRFLDFGGWEVLIAVVCVVASLIVLGPRLRTGMRLDDHRPGDYPPHYAAVPVLGWAGSLVASAPVFDVIDERIFASPLVGWLSAAGLAAGLTVFGAWSVRRVEGRDARVGQRRARAIVASTDISEVTEARLEAFERHGDLVATLAGVGAIDGVQVRAWKLAQLTGTSVEEVTAAGRELAELGLVRIANIGLDSATRHWWLSLSEVGVRVGAELPRR
ncbi:hypothetical protein B841_10060 [Corynebacterium maris DSM 45190]|uniref:Uncharacterized protein n=1 Tax=Corynebacterium maris DSM 45190 TaxID=1224163 RepID=S5SWB2_9CORY|nr:hypothetical protein B841_10060 [Corynebacterium maris DSM 45190]